MVYKCLKCNKEFNRKSHYDYHINRIRSCVSLYDDKNNNNIKITQKHTITTQNHTNSLENIFLNNKTFNSDIINDDNYELICTYCNKKFSRKDSLNRHLTIYCKIKIQKCFICMKL